MLQRPGLTLLEVLIALLILGVVAALAIPRPGAAAVAPSAEHLLRADLQILRVAIARYYQDHGVYPGQNGDGRNPAGTAATVIAQLTQYSNVSGLVSATRDAEHCYGPYLRDGVPPGRMGPLLGNRELQVVRAGQRTPAAETAAWLYEIETVHIAVNSRELDSAGLAYDVY